MSSYAFLHFWQLGSKETLYIAVSDFLVSHTVQDSDKCRMKIIPYIFGIFQAELNDCRSLLRLY